MGDRPENAYTQEWLEELPRRYRQLIHELEAIKNRDALVKEHDDFRRENEKLRLCLHLIVEAIEGYRK